MGENTFYLVDAGFDTSMRPAMYGSYHEISICAADGRELAARDATSSSAGHCANRATCSRRKRAAWL